MERRAHTQVLPAPLLPGSLLPALGMPQGEGGWHQADGTAQTTLQHPGHRCCFLRHLLKANHPAKAATGARKSRCLPHSHVLAGEVRTAQLHCCREGGEGLSREKREGGREKANASQPGKDSTQALSPQTFPHLLFQYGRNHPPKGPSQHSPGWFVLVLRGNTEPLPPPQHGWNDPRLTNPPMGQHRAHSCTSSSVHQPSRPQSIPPPPKSAMNQELMNLGDPQSPPGGAPMKQG